MQSETPFTDLAIILALLLAVLLASGCYVQAHSTLKASCTTDIECCVAYGDC